MMVESEEHSEPVEELPQEPIKCGCSDHYDNLILDTIFGTSVDKLFKMFFSSSSHFMEIFNQKRKVKGSP